VFIRGYSRLFSWVGFGIRGSWSENKLVAI